MFQFSCFVFFVEYNTFGTNGLLVFYLRKYTKKIIISLYLHFRYFLTYGIEEIFFLIRLKLLVPMDFCSKSTKIDIVTIGTYGLMDGKSISNQMWSFTAKKFSFLQKSTECHLL